MSTGADGVARGRRFVASSMVCFLSVAGLAVWVRSGVPGVDASVHAAIVRWRSSGDLALARVLTNGGSTNIVWPLIVVASVIFPRSTGPRRWLHALAVGAGAGAAIGGRLLLSDIVGRARPPQMDWAGSAAGSAFPSGHTTAATLGAGLLAWAVTRRVASWRMAVRRGVWALAVVYALVVGWTRMWLGVHWPLDVLGGWLLGSGWLTATAFVVRASAGEAGAIDAGPATVARVGP